MNKFVNCRIMKVLFHKFHLIFPFFFVRGTLPLSENFGQCNYLLPYFINQYLIKNAALHCTKITHLINPHVTMNESQKLKKNYSSLKFSQINRSFIIKHPRDTELSKKTLKPARVESRHRYIIIECDSIERKKKGN